MPLSEQKKQETKDRLDRDPDFREEFLVSARNMYMKALEFDGSLEPEIEKFEKILCAEPDSYELDAGEADEIDIFERILDAYDNQVLLDEKNASTIN